MSDLGIQPFLVLSAFLFACGVVCVASKRNAIGVLMGVELILNAANVNLVAFARFNPAFRLDYTVGPEDLTLTGTAIGVGIFGGYAAIIAVFLGIAGFSPRTVTAAPVPTPTAGERA